MLNTNGGRFGGYGLYLLKGKPVFTHNLVDFARFKWEGKDAVAAGKHTIEFEFTYDGPGLGKGGTGVLKVDGKEVANQKVPAHDAVHLPVGRDVRRRQRHRHAGGRQGLPVPVRLHRQAREADRQDRPEPDAAGGEEGSPGEGWPTRLSLAMAMKLNSELHGNSLDSTHIDRRNNMKRDRIAASTFIVAVLAMIGFGVRAQRPAQSLVALATVGAIRRRGERGSRRHREVRE